MSSVDKLAASAKSFAEKDATLEEFKIGEKAVESEGAPELFVSCIWQKAKTNFINRALKSQPLVNTRSVCTMVATVVLPVLSTIL